MSEAKKRVLMALMTDASYNADAKADFHRVAKRFLSRLRKRLDDRYGKSHIRSNKGGIAVSGEVTLHMERVYIQVSQGVGGPKMGILFRTCNGLQDYTGGPNNFAHIENLLDTETLARLIETRCPLHIGLDRS